MAKTLSRKECISFFKKHNSSGNDLAHCIAVSKIAVFLAKELSKKGEKVNIQLVENSALLHDVVSEPRETHDKAGAEFLEKQGLSEIANIVRTHSLFNILEKNALDSWEKKIVFYSDKRCRRDKPVSLQERFEYFKNRYGSISSDWMEKILKSEKLCFELEKQIFEKIDVDTSLSGLNAKANSKG